MIALKDLNRKAQQAALHGAKTPHGISNPVIRMEGEKYYAAYFVYTYGKDNLSSNKYPRPAEWILADLDSGEIAAVYESNEKDFSDQKTDKLYYI